MQFYAVNYALEQKYFVEKTAFLQSIALAFKYVKNIEVLNYWVSLDEDNVNINIDINIKKNVNFELAITSLQEAVEDGCYSLIDVNPTNIKIDIKGII